MRNIEKRFNKLELKIGDTYGIWSIWIYCFFRKLWRKVAKNKYILLETQVYHKYKHFDPLTRELAGISDTILINDSEYTGGFELG